MSTQNSYIEVLTSPSPLVLYLEGELIKRYLQSACIPSHVQLFATLCTGAHHAPLSVGFFRQEYWSRLPFPPPGDLPNPGIEPVPPALAGRYFTAEPSGKTQTALQFSPWVMQELCTGGTQQLALGSHRYVRVCVHREPFCLKTPSFVPLAAGPYSARMRTMLGKAIT